MSYSHAGNSGEQRNPLAPLDPALFEPPEMRAALAAQDISTVYQLLKVAGISQRQIVRRTGQSQSEVCEIIKGRKVRQYEVLARICDGLGIPRELMGLSYGARGAPTLDGVTVAEPPEGVNSEMRRRALIAVGALAAFGQPVLGAPERLPGPLDSAELPNRLGWHHVTKVRDTTHRLGWVDGHSADPDVCSEAAARADRLLNVEGAEPVQRALLTAVAELHIEAGWAAFDATRYERALHHFGRALEVATQAGDRYCEAVALNYAGLASIEHGHPDDGLKMLQLGQVTSWRIPRDDRRMVVVGETGKAAVDACALADSATALADLGHEHLAAAELAKSRDLWQPTPADPFGDPARVAARFEFGRGRLDVAEQHAAASVRRWEGVSEGGRTRSGIVLATIHVRAGEPRGLTMTKTVLDAVAQLDSQRTRLQLAPLVGALDARPGADARELARMARKVAATQAA
ncbi:MAG: helix-turn-helix domain-containing protein [Pseudonocardiaceae bacterium]